MFGKFEGSYDYILNDISSIGTTISVSPNTFLYNQYKSETFSIKFNYKMYFSKKRAQGFYVEFYSEYANGKNFQSINTYSPRLVGLPYNDLNIGFNIGYKYVNKKNYFINASIGFGQRITSFNTKSIFNSNGLKPNFTLSIGKRF